MDWDLAIKRNSEALKGIIADLFAMLELAGEATVARLPRSVHSAVLRVLRPAESAVRRLIVIAARGLVVKLAPSRPVSRPKPAKPTAKGIGSSRPPSFQLFDPRKRFKPVRAMKSIRRVPRIAFLSPTRSHGCSHICSAGSARFLPRRRSCAAARWPGQRPRSYPQTPGPQVSP